MNTTTYTTAKTARVIVGYLALVFALAILFTNCTAYKTGCDMNKGFAGYGKTR